MQLVNRQRKDEPVERSQHCKRTHRRDDDLSPSTALTDAFKNTNTDHCVPISYRIIVMVPEDALLPINGLYMHSAAIGGTLNSPAQIARKL